MSCSTTSSANPIPYEQRLELHIIEIHQKLNNLINNEQVNQLWKLVVESTLHSIWNKLSNPHACVSTSCQTDELLDEDCDTSLESAIHFNETSRALREEECELNIEELHNAVEVIPPNSSSVHENEISAPQASSKQPIIHDNANDDVSAKHARFYSDRQKENIRLNETSRTLRELDNRFASNAEDESELNGEEQQDVVEVIPPNSSSGRENEMLVSDASSEQSTQSADKSRPNPVQFYQCSHCESNFFSQVEMSLHERTHAKPSSKCGNCLHVFTNRGSFIAHLRFCSYRPNENGSFECADCGKSYSTRRKLTFHLRYHRERKHKCIICGRAFTCPSHVNTHMVTHTGATPFSCKLCPKSYSRSSSLRNHVLLHHAK